MSSSCGKLVSRSVALASALANCYRSRRSRTMRRMDIKLLTEFEKAAASASASRSPSAISRLSDEEMDARIAAAKATLGERLVILGHHYQRDEVIKFADYTGDSFKLVARGRQHAQGRVHRLLRRALHGRERRHPPRAASEGDAARSGRRLLDGRHGRARSARDLLARAGADGRRPTRSNGRRRRPGHLHQFVGGDQGLRGEHGGIVCTSTNAAATS